MNKLLVVLIIFGSILVPTNAQIEKYIIAAVTHSNSSSNYGKPQILLTSIFSDGIYDWGKDKTLKLNSEGSNIQDVTLLDDKEGGVYILYTNELFGGDMNIAIRRISPKGIELFGDSKNPVVYISKSKNIEKNPKAIVLDDGSLIIAYEVHYLSNRDIDIAAARISKTGTKIWNSNIWVSNSSNKKEKLSSLTSDGRGGAVLVVETSSVELGQVDEDIIANHIDIAGKLGWDGNSTLPINVAASKHIERNATVASNGNGGVVVAFEVEYTSGNKVSDVDIFAQSISAIGKKLWGESPIVVSSATSVREYEPVLAADKEGITVAFEMLVPVNNIFTQMIGVQRIDLNGKSVWNEGKKAKYISLSKKICEKPSVFPDGVGGAFFLFEVYDSSTQDRDIYAQRLNLDGSDMWGDALPEPIISSNSSIEQNLNAIVVKNNALVVAAIRTVNLNLPNKQEPNRSVVIQKITLDGTYPWKEIDAPITLVFDKDMDKKISIINLKN